MKGNVCRCFGMALVVGIFLSVYGWSTPSSAFESSSASPLRQPPLDVIPSQVLEDQENRKPHPVEREIRVYLVRQGDSLWKIARRFGMPAATLAEMNELAADEILQVGRPLKVAVLAPEELTLNFSPRPMSEDTPVLYQLRMTDGRPVPQWMVKDLVVGIAAEKLPGTAAILGVNGNARLGKHIQFRLVKNHLAARARRFQSIVLIHAERFGLDPALIMAMIHTESFFNPRARSKAPAYGLMQLVPHTAGKEAYQRIYGERRKLTPQYLYDPENNIELGTAYFNILKDRYLGAIVDPTSRTYCAVAAYHAGPSRVGRAFTPKSSIKLAAPVINSLDPQQVYERLVDALPSIESRNYVRKVLARVRMYSGWSFQNQGAL